LTSKVIASGKAVLIGSFISKGISIISSIILARLLFEDDYGALVISTIFAGLITQVGGMGYEIYYLQYKGSLEEKKKVLAQVYNLRLLTNGIMFLVQALIGIYFLLFTSNKMSGGILIMMAFSLLLEGFNAPQETLLKNNMEFKKITIGNIFKEFFNTVGKIVAAVAGLGGYAFGVGPILGSLTRLIYLRKVQTYKHEYFNWDKNKIKDIFNFGKHVLFGSAGMYLVQQIDRIFLSVFFPKNIVGQYGFAWGNAAMPFNYLVSPQQQLILTYITKFKVNTPELFDKLLVITRLISLFLFPITIFALTFTDELVKTLVTEKWITTVPMIRITLLYFTFLSVIFPFSSLLTGLGFPNITSKLTVIKAIILGLSLFIVSSLFEGNIIIYIITFSVISILLDLVKAIWGIYKTSVRFKEIRSKMSSETLPIIMVVLSYFSYFYKLGMLLNIFMVTAMVSILIIFYLLFDQKRTRQALILISFK